LVAPLLEKCSVHELQYCEVPRLVGPLVALSPPIKTIDQDLIDRRTDLR
jgi:hypothetical protein